MAYTFSGEIVLWDPATEHGVIRRDDDGRDVEMTGLEYAGHITVHLHQRVQFQIVETPAGWRAVAIRPEMLVS